MAARVVRVGEISINGKLYRLGGNRRVQFFQANVHPGKVVEGEYTDETNPLASTIAWVDLSGGIGKEIHDPKNPGDIKRVWWSTGNLRHPGQSTLPIRVTEIAQASTSVDVDQLLDFGNQVYECRATAVYVYNSYSNTHTNVRTLLNAATDWDRGLLYPSGVWTDTLVIATGSEVDYATSSTVWARNTDIPIKYVCFFGDLLWGITNAGRLYYTDDLSTSWTPDAQLQLPSGYVIGLKTAPGPDERRHLYAVTRVGIYGHVSDEARFEETGFANLPYHPQGGTGAGNWRTAIVYPAGSGAYLVGFTPDARAAIPFGPDRDHGLPSNKRGNIVKVAESHNELFAALEACTGSGFWEADWFASAGAGSSRQSTFGTSTGYSMVLGWNQQGWQVTWQSGATDRAITALHAANAYNSYQLWWACNRKVYRMPLPVDVANPLKLAASEYAASDTTEYPWFDAGSRNQSKNALSIPVETTNPSTGETVAVYYGLNWNDTTWTSAGSTITASGETRFYLGTNRKGIPFRAIRLRADKARGAGNIRSTPIVRLVGLSYERNIRLLWGIRAQLDITEDSPDGTPTNTQLANLRSVMQGTSTGELVEVTYRDDGSDVQNYYMRPRGLTSLEDTGPERIGQVMFEAVEPEQSTSR